jgi:hypothetical protein
MNLTEDLQIEKYTASLWYEVGRIEFILDFEWSFVSFDEETNECIVDVWLEKGEQWFNNVCHPFTPAKDELKEIITAIEDYILEDPERFGVLAWEESNKDFYNDLNYDKDDY